MLQPPRRCTTGPTTASYILANPAWRCNPPIFHRFWPSSSGDRPRNRAARPFGVARNRPGGIEGFCPCAARDRRHVRAPSAQNTPNANRFRAILPSRTAFPARHSDLRQLALPATAGPTTLMRGLPSTVLTVHPIRRVLRRQPRSRLCRRSGARRTASVQTLGSGLLPLSAGNGALHHSSELSQSTLWGNWARLRNQKNWYDAKHLH